MINQADLQKRMNKLWQILVQSVFPRRCPVCEEIAKGEYICPDCFRKLHFVREPICMVCGKEIRREEEELCSDCTRKGRSFEFGRALLCYDEISENAMVKIKYKNKREYIDGFAKMLAFRYRALAKKLDADCVIPVPIHKKRRRERGFNQAELIAEILSKEWNIPLNTDSLIRTKNTRPQKALLSNERERNLKSAFSVRDLPKNCKRVILVDDIFTTGSTIEACTRELNKERKIEVYFFSLCIGTEKN